MKNKIIFWENECLSSNLLNDILDTDLFTIVGKLQLGYDGEESKEIFRLEQLQDRASEWDYLIYAYPQSELLDRIINVLTIIGVDLDKCINLFEISSTSEKKRLLLSKILRYGNRLYDRTIYNNMRRMGDYVAVSAEGLSFVANATDIEIPQKMYETKQVWASDDMIRLGELLEKYYSIGKESIGHFFDIGANIGTTSIYIKKYILPLFMAHSFEPIQENFKLLNINYSLNNITDYIVNNVAASDVRTEYNMKKVLDNWGMCSITDENGDDTESVKSIRIDDYIMESGITNSDNLVFWVDTEGFEIDVLFGAREILKNKPALFLEFNLQSYGERVDEMISLLCEHYSGYISFADDSNVVIGDISLLKNVKEQTDIFLIP
ncbi:MAG: FkbM family methyltransferase [Lachnospiraceae bacterium]|nr:FkbM family methyltransferase [Lachnospiraceae bacterium]